MLRINNVLHYLLLLLLYSITFQYNKIVKRTEDVWVEDLWSTDSLPATCAYSLYISNLSETTNEPRKEKYLVNNLIIIIYGLNIFIEVSINPGMWIKSCTM